MSRRLQVSGVACWHFSLLLAVECIKSPRHTAHGLLAGPGFPDCWDSTGARRVVCLRNPVRRELRASQGRLRGVLARGESGSGSGGPRLEPMFHTKPVGRAPRSRHLNRQKLTRFFTCARVVRCCARATCQEYAWLCSIVRRRQCHSIKTRCVRGGGHTQLLFGGVSVIRRKFAARSHLWSETPVSTRLSVENLLWHGLLHGTLLVFAAEYRNIAR